MHRHRVTRPAELGRKAPMRSGTSCTPIATGGSIEERLVLFRCAAQHRAASPRRGAVPRAFQRGGPGCAAAGSTGLARDRRPRREHGGSPDDVRTRASRPRSRT
jgi:hypothetical protein